MQIPRGLRERKKVRTRQAIIDAAWSLFRAQGYDSTTVEEIADGADVSRRTFFRYFPTKESVVFHNSAERLELFKVLLATSGCGFESVFNACLAMARHYAKNRDEVVEQYRLIESSPALIMREGEIDREWMMAIAEILADPASDDDADRRGRILAGAVFGAMRATLSEWFTSDGEVDLEALGVQAMSIFGKEYR